MIVCYEGSAYTFIGPYMVPQRPRVLVSDIQREVSKHFGIHPNEMQSARRVREVVRPRQIAMLLARNLTSKSLPEIGRLFGNRDHSTVIHGIKQIEWLRLIDFELDRDVRALQRRLGA